MKKLDGDARSCDVIITLLLTAGLKCFDHFFFCEPYQQAINFKYHSF